MEKINYKREIPLWMLMLAPVIYIPYIWGQLSDQVPIHFDLHGQANDWGSKGMIFLMPGISLFIYLLLLFLPQIDPKKMSNEFFASNFYKIRVVMSVFFCAISFLLVRLSLAGKADPHMVRYIPIAVLLLMTVLGNFMLTLKPNWFIGVRTPWTLSSDTVWKQTHLVLGRIWFYGGIIATCLAFVVSDIIFVAVVLVFSLGSALFAVGYSFILYKQEQKNNSSQPG